MDHFDLKGALAAGHSRDAIANHLASTRYFDLEAARKDGHSKEVIVRHLAKTPRLNKGGETDKYEFSSTQVNLPESIAKSFRQYSAAVPDDKLAPEEAAGYGGGTSATGRENEPHITLLYGLHGDDPSGVVKLLSGVGPIKAVLGKTAIFPASESGGADVLKVDVESVDLRRLNKKIADSLPHTTAHPIYKPHATLAYLLAGEGKAYAGKIVPGVTGRKIKLNSVVFSARDGKRTVIALSRKDQKGAESPRGEAPFPIE